MTDKGRPAARTAGRKRALAVDGERFHKITPWDLIQLGYQRHASGRYIKPTVLRGYPPVPPRIFPQVARLAKQLGWYDWSDAIEEVLPYGQWLCADGRAVLFNRAYQPIWEKYGGEVFRCESSSEHVLNIVGEHWFWSGRVAPWNDQSALDLSLAILRQWGIIPGGQNDSSKRQRQRKCGFPTGRKTQ
jgi:hypothetical protein